MQIEQKQVEVTVQNVKLGHLKKLDVLVYNIMVE